MHTSAQSSTLFTTLLLTLLLSTFTLALPYPNRLQRQNHQQPIALTPAPTSTSTNSTPRFTTSCGTPGTLISTSSPLPGSPFAGIPAAPHCASHCLSTPTCLSFSYNQINGSCSLFHDGLEEMGVQKRGGAVFWWDRACFDVDELEGDAEGENEVPAVAMEMEVEVKSEMEEVHALIDDALADVVASTAEDEDDATQEHDEAPLASLLRSSIASAPVPPRKVWPYGVGALPAEDDEAKRAWTWEGKAQMSLGQRRARGSSS